MSQSPNNLKVIIMDIGRNPSSSPEVDITQSNLLKTPLQEPPPPKAQGDPTSEQQHKILNTLDRDTYIKALSRYAAAHICQLYRERQIHAVLGIGGSCGTALATSAMRDGLPVGFPKLMVSTMVSGDVSPYIGETDIGMMYSVVDIAGRNRVLDAVLRNAGSAIAGMARSFFESSFESEETSDIAAGSGTGSTVRIGISMFGVTTPAVAAARKHLEFILPGCEVYVFHATGSGGRAMERLTNEGQLDAILDLTTTEIADEVVGGVLSAGPRRLISATERDIPRVVSVGACDMVNFGTFESVPEKFINASRIFHKHNPTVTIMRTTAEECRDIASLLVKNIRGASWTKVLLPVGGVSMVDTPGQPFWNPEVDQVLFSTLEEGLRGSGIDIIRDERDINHTEFAVLAAEMLRDLIKVKDRETTT